MIFEDFLNFVTNKGNFISLSKKYKKIKSDIFDTNDFATFEANVKATQLYTKDTVNSDALINIFHHYLDNYATLNTTISTDANFARDAADIAASDDYVWKTSYITSFQAAFGKSAIAPLSMQDFLKAFFITGEKQTNGFWSLVTEMESGKLRPGARDGDSLGKLFVYCSKHHGSSPRKGWWLNREEITDAQSLTIGAQFKSGFIELFDFIESKLENPTDNFSFVNDVEHDYDEIGSKIEDIFINRIHLARIPNWLNKYLFCLYPNVFYDCYSDIFFNVTMDYLRKPRTGSFIEVCKEVAKVSKEKNIQTRQLSSIIGLHSWKLDPEISFQSSSNDAEEESEGASIDETSSISKSIKQRYIKLAQNTILYGPPGTGKTYCLKKIILSNEDNSFDLNTDYDTVCDEFTKRKIEDRMKFVTFHQSYGYDDFIGGIKPSTDSKGNIVYSYEKGVFAKFCELANNHLDDKYYFVIDEINRGNVSKIFGELITLIEDTKRSYPGNTEALPVTLPNGDKLSVPGNVYIIGTMNTADKSISNLDTALRRRFQFIEMMPDVVTTGLDSLTISDNEGTITINVGEMLSFMNMRIESILDRDHMIGHAYFMPLFDDASFENLADIFKNKIIPLLQEYFYDDYKKIKIVLGGANFISEKVPNRDSFFISNELFEDYGLDSKSIYTIINSEFYNPINYLRIYKAKDEEEA